MLYWKTAVVSVLSKNAKPHLIVHGQKLLFLYQLQDP